MDSNAKDTGDDKELSMEEILQSIRKIIAEDGEDKAADEDISDSEEDVPGSEVLELTEMLQDDGSVVSLPPATAEPPAKADSGDILNKIDEALASEPKTEPKIEPKAKTEPKAEPVAAVPQPTPAPTMEESLLSDVAAQAASAALKRLRTAEAPPVHSPAQAFRSGTTIEDLVTEMLKPMMKTWLDENLPDIVETIVEREVKKLAHH